METTAGVHVDLCEKGAGGRIVKGLPNVSRIQLGTKQCRR